MSDLKHQDLSEYRSHRWLGEQMDLFHFSAHSPGMACWHPRGLRVYRALEEYCRELGERYSYEEVRSPLVCDSRLWERSGHAEKFADKMFALSVDGHPAALKPMNCPGHADLYALRPRSYRELPLRLWELGHVHRLEQSGELNGLLRARSFVIDDAHLFCAPEQVPGELAACLHIAQEVYALVGLGLRAELSLRPAQRLGDDALWDAAERGLRDALDEAGLAYVDQPGEGAFYGPKVDLHINDALGRAWQMGSVQLDFQLPIRFDLRYVGPDGRDESRAGEPYRPVMVHRAMFGSLERFIAILIEHFDGRFPLWLAPEAVRVLPVGADQHAYAHHVAARLRAAGVPAGVDPHGPLGGRIRAAQSLRVPVVAVTGAREADAGAAALRRGADQRVVGLDEAVESLGAEVRERRR